MNRRNVAIVAGIGAAIAFIGMNLYEPEKKASPAGTVEAPPQYPATPTAKVKTFEETVVDAAEALTAPEGRSGALEALELALGPQGGKELSVEGREKVAAKVIRTWEEALEDERELKASALRLLAGRIGGEGARTFASTLLASGPDEAKLELLRVLAGPNAIGAKAIYSQAADVARTGIAPEEQPALIRKALGKKAAPELFALIETELGPKALRACAVELQNLGGHEALGKVLERLDAKGLLEKNETMPWFSSRILSEHIRKAQGAELTRALKVVQTRPSLTKATLGALKERLGDADPSVRRTIAKLIPQAVVLGAAPVEGEQALSEQLGKEQDEAVKTALNDALAQVRNASPEPAETAPVPEPEAIVETH